MKGFSSLARFASVMFAGLIAALPAASSYNDELRTVHQFPDFTWIENMVSITS
jgi:hypothetical protein